MVQVFCSFVALGSLSHVRYVLSTVAAKFNWVTVQKNTVSEKYRAMCDKLKYPSLPFSPRQVSYLYYVHGIVYNIKPLAPSFKVKIIQDILHTDKFRLLIEDNE